MKRKSNETEAPEVLSELQSAAVANWAREQYRGLTGLEIREYEAECLDWHRSTGRSRVDWVATVRNWIRQGQRFKRERSRTPPPGASAKLSEKLPAKVLALTDRFKGIR